MPNRAAQLRQRVLAERPNAVVEARGQNWLRHADGNRRILDTTIGPLHYDDAGEWREINTDWVEMTDRDIVPDASYRVEVHPDTDRTVWPRRDHPDESIYFMQFEIEQRNGDWEPLDFRSRRGRNEARLEWHEGIYDVFIHAKPGGVKYELALNNRPGGQATGAFRIGYVLTGLTLDGQNLVSIADGTVVGALREMTIQDSSGSDPLPLGESIVPHPSADGAFYFTPDFTGLTFPVVIDPTIDTDPAADADDGYTADSGTFQSGLVNATIGIFLGSSLHGFFLVPITGPVSGDTVSVAYLDLFASHSDSGTTCSVSIVADDQNSPSAPTTAADLAGRTRTTASTSWSSIASWTAGDNIQSPSIVSVIQELWDSGFGLDGENILIILDDNGSTSSAIRRIATRENTSYDPLTLHIEYTAAGGTTGILQGLQEIHDGVGVVAASQLNGVIQT